MAPAPSPAAAASLAAAASPPAAAAASPPRRLFFLGRPLARSPGCRNAFRASSKNVSFTHDSVATPLGDSSARPDPSVL